MHHQQIDEIITIALQEDIGSGDLTAELIPKNNVAKAKIISRQAAVICGKELVTKVFHKIDSTIKINWFIEDGANVKANTTLCELEGNARSLLTGERTALNFLQTLSSTATLTKQFVEALKGTNTKLLDTRKTLPGLRLAQKYAVTCGGGYNHRFGLYDAVLIKENHIMAAGSITAAINKARSLYPDKCIEVEVQNLSELKEALTTSVNIVMLDNFTLDNIRKAVKIAAGKVKLEISGGVTLKTIHALAETGVDYISVGAITKTVMPIELSMLFANTN